MKRSKSHVIDERAQKILIAQFPDNWVHREQKPDYGIDYEIQVFDGEYSSETWFRIQLKGIEKPKETEDYIHFNFKTDTLEYYMSKVPFPVFLFVVNVSTNEVYWIFLQEYVNEILKVENPDWSKQQTITIKIPKENIFENNSKKVEFIAREGIKYTNLLVFGIPDWSTSFKVKNAMDDIDKFRLERDKRFIEQNEIDIELGVKYHQASYEKESREMFNEVLERTKDKDGAILEHLSAMGGLLFTFSVIDEYENREAFKLSNYGKKLAEKFHNKQFMYLFNGAGFEAEYYNKMRKIQTYSIMQKMNSHRAEYTNLIDLYQSSTYKELLDVSKKYIENLYNSFEDKEYGVSLYLMLCLIKMNLDPYPWLINNRTKDELKPLLDNISSLIEDALILADTLNTIDFKCEILECKAVLFFYQNKNYKDILTEMKKFAIENNLDHFVEISDDFLKEFDQETPFPEGAEDINEESIDDISDEELNELLISYAHRWGFDYDISAEIIRIGIKDRNPERILKNCSHIEIATGHQDFIAEQLNLPTAGSKVIFCKYCNGEYGPELDTIYELFRKKYCKECQHCDPMPNEWNWSSKWENEKEWSNEFKKFINNL